jgi:SAM-dependent methyltransferase
VSRKLIVVPEVPGLIFLGAAILVPLLGIVAALFLLIALCFGLAHYRFSAAGGDIQSKIIALLLDRVEWTGQGKVLDIGCRNGQLTVRLAKRYPQVQVTGMDTWGKNWDYG